MTLLEMGRRSSRSCEVLGPSTQERRDPLGQWQKEFMHSNMPVESKLLKTTKGSSSWLQEGLKGESTGGCFYLLLSRRECTETKR